MEEGGERTSMRGRLMVYAEANEDSKRTVEETNMAANPIAPCPFLGTDSPSVVS